MFGTLFMLDTFASSGVCPMFRESQSKQLTLSDHYINAGTQAKTAVEKSRARMVGDYFYDNVDESKFAPLFSKKGSRPNIEIKRYVSALVLKRMYGLSDAVFLEFLRCGALNFQYALHTTSEDQQPLSEVSLFRFRARLRKYTKETGTDLVKEEFERISKKMAVDMGLLNKDPSEDSDASDVILVRMDSMEIEAHAKAMPRLEILYTTVLIVIRYLLRCKMEGVIPESLSHYLKDEDKNQVLYYRLPEEEKEQVQQTRIEKVIREMEDLQAALDANFTSEFLSKIPEYQVFTRVRDEQTFIGEDGKRHPKDKKDISPDSVQNPFDTTVTYRYKRGQHHGSVLNVAEAHDTKGNGIIIDGELCANTTADTTMEEHFLNKQEDNGSAIKLEADGAYSSDRLEELAKQKNVEIATTSLTGKLPDQIFAEFVLDETETAILECPEKKVPVSNKYNEKNAYITAVMPENCCASCPHREKCKAMVNNKKQRSTVRVYTNNIKRAKKVKQLGTDEAKETSHHRNAVEGVMSVMRRKYHLDEIPVFGITASAVWVWTSLISYNLAKYQNYLRSLDDLKKQPVAC